MSLNRREFCSLMPVAVQSDIRHALCCLSARDETKVSGWLKKTPLLAAVHYGPCGIDHHASDRLHDQSAVCGEA